jgi:dTDP-glucose 4,6-dehydratase
MILVTGGAGFIGSNYLHYLQHHWSDTPIVCLDVLTYAANYQHIKDLIDKKRIHFEFGDIANEEVVTRVFKKYNPNYIVHFAAESHVDNSIKNYRPFINSNILGTINLLQKSLDLLQIKKFVHISTDEVYGSLGLDESRSFTELSHYETNSPYSASKAASDCFVRAFYSTYGLPTVITNCSNNYGPNQNSEKFIPTIIKNAVKNKPVPIYGNGMNIRDWLYVSDHCQAIQLVLEKGMPGERYNIGGGTEITNLDLAKIILAKLNCSEDLISFVKDRPGHDLRYSIDDTKIRTTLGYQPRYSLDRGLDITIDYYQTLGS